VSLRLRLALWWGTLTGLLVLVAGTLGYTAEGLALYNEIDLEVRALAVQTAGATAGVAAPDLGPALRTVAPRDAAVRAYGADGALLAEAPDGPPAPALDPRGVLARPAGPAYDAVVRLLPPYRDVEGGAGGFGLVEEPAGARWRVYVLPAAAPAAYVVALAPLAPTDAFMATLRWLVPALAALSAALVLAASALLAGRLLRPVAALTDTAAAIARAREFGRRVPTGRRRDELGHLAATFNGMLDSLEAAYRQQQRFVADASHELRAPLTVILANLELLERQPGLPASERQEALQEAARETRRLVRLVADLLALARADAGTPQRRQRVELDRVLVEAFGQMRQLAGGRGLTVEALEPVLVGGDADQLRQLLLALIDNALKYTPPGGRVALGLRRRGRWAEVTVQDTGIGIDPEHLPHVFERFYRADPARQSDPGGTGLGLAIARWIAEQHGGEVVLASEPGRGTTATVRLPVLRELPATGCDATPPAPAPAGEAPGAPGLRPPDGLPPRGRDAPAPRAGA
jgi:signal transduction histidine kinase